MARNGVHAILCMLTGPETGGWFREPISSLEDIKGLRLRMAGLGAQTPTKLGMSVTTLPLGETFPALERGAIIHTFPEDMIAAFRAANSDVMAELSAADADVKATHDPMEAHRARVNGCISENSVD